MNIYLFKVQSVKRVFSFFLPHLFAKKYLVVKISVNVSTRRIETDRHTSKYLSANFTNFGAQPYGGRGIKLADVKVSIYPELINSRTHLQPPEPNNLTVKDGSSLLLGKLLSMYLTQRSKALNRL